MKNSINLTAHVLPENQMQVTLTFDRRILLANKLNAEQDIIHVFVHELSEVTDKALGFNFDLMNMPSLSKYLN